MRHRVYGKHFGRNKDERRGLFNGLVRSLFLYGTIQTSEVKAKAIKGLVDKIINSVKKDSFVNDKILTERIKEVLPKLGNKTSGYTSMVRLGTRLGDQTTMVKLSLIGAEELKQPKKESKSQVAKATEPKEPEVKKAVPAKKITNRKTSVKRKAVKE